MQLRYGSFVHQRNSVEPVITTEKIRSDRGFALRLRQRWQLKGTVYASSSSEMTSLLSAMEAAYNQDFQDAIFVDDSGAATVHALRNGSSFDGVKVTAGIDYPSGQDIYSLAREWTATLEAEFPIDSAQNAALAGAAGADVLEYVETLQISGGGPRRTLIEPPSGPPIVVTYVESAGWYATQSGSLTSRLENPPIPAPIWPNSLAGPPIINETSPIVRTGQEISFTKTWQYDFVSATALVGRPHASPF